MYNHSYSEKSNYTRLVDALTKAIIDFNLSEKHHHEVFLNSFKSPKTQIKHNPSPPSSNSVADEVSLAPIIPLKPTVINSTITIQYFDPQQKQSESSLVPGVEQHHEIIISTSPIQELQPPEHLTDTASITMAETSHEADGFAATVTDPTAETIFAIAQVKLRQRGLGSMLGEDKQQSMLAWPWLHDFGDGFAIHSSRFCYAFLFLEPLAATLPSPEMTAVPITLPSSSPPWFAAKQGYGSCILATAAARQIAPTAAVGSCNIPVIFRFCFDPGGPLPDVYHSAVRRRLHVRRFTIPPSPFPSSEPPSRASPAPSPSVRSGSSPAMVPFPVTVMAPPSGAASCWPWVPWSNSKQSILRVSMGMCC